jgi:uncharacterized membrane protein YtjA (UPF0391 family)
VPLIKAGRRRGPHLPQASRPAGPDLHQTRACPAQETVMLHYAIVFLVIALIAALFGFGGIAAGAVSIAKILFFVFVVMAIVAFIVSIGRRG